MEKNRHQLILSTCPDKESAERIARALVSERLAACANILPIAQSVYLWQGKIESAAEQLLLIKSMTEAYNAIEKRILELHPYELPEVIAVSIADGLDAYLSWINNPEERS